MVGNRPPILILRAAGTNRDREAAWACELAGGAPEIVDIRQLVSGERRLADFLMLVLPGGFSYGDDLGAGRLLAVRLRHQLGDALAEFIASGRPVLGICNGFQALVKAGALPGDSAGGLAEPRLTLTRNDSARFECRWIHLRPEPGSRCIFTRGLDELIECPVAHGEGKLVARDPETLNALQAAGQIALRYVDADGRPTGYPGNPNGSPLGIAGVCNASGNLLGLMPHPEDHALEVQHPRRGRGAPGALGLVLFENGVQHARSL
ncbi:MAG: phosphoribosylformylglycinamidine synthase I [Deltaproteobacteria bacterium]|nr:phosphoribosylformylglycinamidine synthase I [Deltaproteobacteria bacterium]